uniref:Uncharacterized protein n=1 Tax=Anguilla anguilla TaxID=7936 RepID=A0A0E9VR14_ANGAN
MGCPSVPTCCKDAWPLTLPNRSYADPAGRMLLILHYVAVLWPKFVLIK